ncbi:hypothetical protein [Halobellus ruber]|uniref:Uncharacterized protein n=1 Tax=Halobellus ruber TaxID=2761102 RepID=A0A7J9SK82_9EURY|nr:hypothetical protein [Halobellus ruber]MBB6647370.1 hypothetical protein [Halobellus ruber]
MENLGKRRLEGRYTAFESEFEMLKRRADAQEDPPEWAGEIDGLLTTGRAAIEDEDLEYAWYCLHAAERLKLYAVAELDDSDAVLRREAAERLVETENLAPSWRSTAVTERLTGDDGSLRSDLSDADLRSAAELLHEGYHKIHSKRQHLQDQFSYLLFYGAISTALFAVVSLSSPHLPWLPSPFFDVAAALEGTSRASPVSFLLYVVLFGALGASVFGLYSVRKRPTSASAPQYLTSRRVALSRLTVGVASALAVFFFVRSGAIVINVGGGTGDGPFLLTLAFVAGYSERLVHTAVESIAETAEPGGSGGGGS